MPKRKRKNPRHINSVDQLDEAIQIDLAQISDEALAETMRVDLGNLFGDGLVYKADFDRALKSKMFVELVDEVQLEAHRELQTDPYESLRVDDLALVLAVARLRNKSLGAGDIL